jgi:hypothetical protein
MRLITAALALLALAGTAAAAPVWTAPGWYQVEDTVAGPFVWKGPFDSKEACEAVLPANTEDEDFSCEYLSERPSWDD